MREFWKSVVTSLVLSLAVGCGGGGGSSCPDETPLACSNDTCCPRGYPYSCGTGYCYQYGCPAGSPSLSVCEFKSGDVDNEQVDISVPVIDEKQAKMCVPEGYPIEDISQSDAGN
jgi:hypothetical protein